MSAPEPDLRRRLLESELALNARACDEVVAHAWGRSFLSPSLPDVWDANFVLIERPGLSPREAIAAAEEALAERRHRKLLFADEAEGERLSAAIGALPGWELETTLRMVWEGDGELREPAAAVAEVGLEDCAELRHELIRGEFPAEMEGREETAKQLVEWGRRLTAPGDRWFVAPAERPAATCCLLGGDPAQIDDVATLPAARGRGLARSVVLAALAASRAAGNRTTFLSADAADWPRHLYERLGFRTRATLHGVRREPGA